MNLQLKLLVALLLVGAGIGIGVTLQRPFIQSSRQTAVVKAIPPTPVTTESPTVMPTTPVPTTSPTPVQGLTDEQRRQLNTLQQQTAALASQSGEAAPDATGGTNQSAQDTYNYFAPVPVEGSDTQHVYGSNGYSADVYHYGGLSIGSDNQGNNVTCNTYGSLTQCW